MSYFKRKSLTNKIFLKERLFEYKVNTRETLEQNLYDLLRMTIELANSGENDALSDENQAIILLNSLPNSFEEVKAAIKYGRTAITFDEVVSALRSRDLELKTEKSTSSNGENYFAGGRSQQKGYNQIGAGKIVRGGNVQLKRTK